MSTLTVPLNERSYDIRIAPALVNQPTEICPWIEGHQVLIITNEIVGKLYLDQVRALFSNKECYEYILPDGEYTKNLENFEAILNKMLLIPCDRHVTIIALGGGVIGDLAGFVSASYQRGVPFIQIPTTLLSQVDSSVGGKTGVNHALGKNMIGAFYQPKRVIADINTLKTLDARQFSSGLAEVIKYGLINDHEMFCWLEQNIDKVIAQDHAALEYVVTRSCQNKSDIVAQDETEKGVRALLNLGHTFGHAIETATGYDTWLHGEAVSIGMMMAAYMSGLEGWINDDDYGRIESLLTKANLPTKPFADVGPNTMRELMQRDKKNQDGQIKLILLKKIGIAEIIAQPNETNFNATLEHFAKA